MNNLAAYSRPVSVDCKKVWWSTGSGLIELQFNVADIEAINPSGLQDYAIKALSLKPYIRRQTDLIDADLLFSVLKEYGVWDDLELRDHSKNVQRILWIAANDVKEEMQ